MTAIALVGVDRPGLPVLLAGRGLTVADGGAVTFGVPGPVVPGPSVMVQANGVREAAAALDAGAGEVVLRSDPDVLVAARLAALVRRLGARTLTVGDLAIDPVERRAMRGGRELPLLPREYAMLLQFVRTPGVTVSRQALRAAVWGRDFDPGTNVIEVHVSRLRAKLHRGAQPMLLTDKGLGYRLVPAPIAGAVAAG